MSGKIDKFRGKNRFLSNFWTAKVGEFDCLEKAYVYSKFPKGTKVVVKGEEVSLRDLIRDGTAGQAKRLGRKYKGLMREDWDDVKHDIMRDLIAEKFSEKNPQLVLDLLATGEAELIEGNTWGDTYWGVVTGGRNKALIGKGENNLGKLLMARRAELRENNP